MEDIHFVNCATVRKASSNITAKIISISRFIFFRDVVVRRSNSSKGSIPLPSMHTHYPRDFHTSFSTQNDGYIYGILLIATGGAFLHRPGISENLHTPQQPSSKYPKRVPPRPLLYLNPLSPKIQLGAGKIDCIISEQLGPRQPLFMYACWVWLLDKGIKTSIATGRAGTPWFLASGQWRWRLLIGKI